jgi:hypothetical protein
MRKAFVVALVLWGLSAGPAAALEIKDLRRTFGPHGGPRPGNEVLPGDIITLAFQVEGLTMEAATGFVKYNIKMEVFDSKGKSIFKRDNKQQQHLSLGGARISERAQIATAVDQAAGKYSLSLTVTDFGSGKAKGGASKNITYAFRILPKGFGLAYAHMPAVLPTAYEATAMCQLVGMARNAKKMPDVELRLRVLDKNGKPTLPKPFIQDLLKLLPDPKEAPEFDIRTAQSVPLPFPIILNRPGDFMVEVEAYDRIAKKTAKLTFPLKVVETSTVVGK